MLCLLGGRTLRTCATSVIMAHSCGGVLVRLELFLICLTSVGVILKGDIVIRPNNTAVVAGQRLELHCGTDNGTKVRQWTFQWKNVFTKWNGPARISSSFSHFELDVDENGSGFIYTNTTRNEDAGIYSCGVQDGQKQLVDYQAHLIVIGKTPECHAENMSSGGKDFIRLQCELCNVNLVDEHWDTKTEWSLLCGNKNDSQETNLADATETTLNNESCIKSEMKVLADNLQTSCFVSCKMLFIRNDSIAVDRTVAHNTASYTIDCGSVRSSSRKTVTSKSSSTSITGNGIHENTTQANPTSSSPGLIIAVPIVISIVIGATVAIAIVFFRNHRRRRRQKSLGGNREQPGDDGSKSESTSRGIDPVLQLNLLQNLSPSLPSGCNNQPNLEELTAASATALASMTAAFSTWFNVTQKLNMAIGDVNKRDNEFGADIGNNQADFQTEGAYSELPYDELNPAEMDDYDQSQGSGPYAKPVSTRSEPVGYTHLRNLPAHPNSPPVSSSKANEGGYLYDDTKSPPVSSSKANDDGYLHFYDDTKSPPVSSSKANDDGYLHLIDDEVKAQSPASKSNDVDGYEISSAYLTTCN